MLKRRQYHYHSGLAIAFMSQSQLFKRTKTLACRDVGFSCDYVARETEEEVMRKGVEHERKEHGLKQENRTPELKQKIRGLRAWWMV